jgi:transcriptional regulator with XRE-family HTH domain
MAREPEQIANLRRALGERLTTFRLAADLTQGQLGKAAICDRTTVAHIESGRSRADERFWRVADDACRADGALLAAFHQFQAVKADQQHQVREAELAEIRAKAAMLRAADTTLAAVGNRGEQSGWTSQSDATVAIQAVATAFRVADRQVGGGHLYRSVLTYLRCEVSPRLFDPTAGELGGSLFAAAASLTEIAGWMAHDGGQDQYARRHFGQAYRLAVVSQQAPLVGNVCASMSHLAGQLGRPDDAIRIADVGLHHARQDSASARLTARLCAMKARGLAMLGSASDCLAALNKAERVLVRARDDKPAKWISHFDEASLAGESALCLRQLGELHEAEQQARRVVELRVGDRVRSRAFGQITLARVLLDARRVEEAANVGREVCAAVGSLTSARVVARLTLLADALRPHESVPGVRAFLIEHAGLAEQKSPQDVDTAWPV